MRFSLGLFIFSFSMFAFAQVTVDVTCTNKKEYKVYPHAVNVSGSRFSRSNYKTEIQITQNGTLTIQQGDKTILFGTVNIQKVNCGLSQNTKSLQVYLDEKTYFVGALIDSSICKSSWDGNEWVFYKDVKYGFFNQHIAEPLFDSWVTISCN